MKCLKIFSGKNTKSIIGKYVIFFVDFMDVKTPACH